MATATHPVSRKMAIAFDFDDTLVPNAYDVLLERLGFDAAEYRQQEYEPRKASGWDGIPARFHGLVEISRSRTAQEGKITQDYLAQLGRELQPFDGVADMFDRLRQRTAAISPDVTLEFYLITSGFLEIARHTSIAQEFKAMWGCEFHYSETGEIVCLKRSLTYPEKPRYLYYISKGIDQADEQDLLFTYRDVPPEALAIPMSQIIYVGDGTSDIPCFSMLNHEGGTAIGVYPEGTAKDWATHYTPSPGERVMNLAPADYREGSELMTSLTLAVESICKNIELQMLSQGK